MNSVRSDATLNLSSLLANTPDVYEVEGEGLLQPEDELLEADGLKLAEPLEWHLVARGTGGDDDYLLEGEVDGLVLTECRRCLDEVVVESYSDFVYPMVYRPGADGLKLIENDGDEEDALEFGKPEVNFAELITQVFAIDLPLTALCKDDCKGLSSDGVNLNEYPHHVPETTNEERTSPFAALKDLEV